jgi:hypothetical protein
MMATVSPLEKESEPQPAMMKPAMRKKAASKKTAPAKKKAPAKKVSSAKKKVSAKKAVPAKKKARKKPAAKKATARQPQTSPAASPDNTSWIACYVYQAGDGKAGVMTKTISAASMDAARQLALKLAPCEEFMLSMHAESDEQFLGQVRLTAMSSMSIN